MKYTGQHIRVRNLVRYQHYKTRTPPWIKLHQELLEDYDFGRLPDASKAHALCLMLLASRLDNRIPADPEWIARKIGARSRVDLDVLIAARFVEVVVEGERDAGATLAGRYQLASDALAACQQDATIEGEGEESRGEREAEAEARAGAREAAAPDPPLDPEDAYCSAVVECFLRQPNVPALALPLDAQLAREWFRAGIPVEIVLREIGDVFAKRQLRRDSRRVGSLRYCAEAVTAAWEEVCAMNAPGQRTEAEPLDVQPRLSRLAAQLPPGLPGRRGYVDRILALDGDSEVVEAALQALGGEVYERMATAFNGADAAEVERQVEASVAALADRLPSEELDAHRHRIRRQLVRQHLRLPALSLFSPEAEGEQP